MPLEFPEPRRGIGLGFHYMGKDELYRGRWVGIPRWKKDSKAGRGTKRGGSGTEGMKK